VKSLEQIIVGCKKNKAWAQADLFKIFSDKMYGVCLYYSENKEDAEDLLHDGFLHIFANIDKLSHDNVEGWMRKTFVNLALMNFRKRKVLFADEAWQETSEAFLVDDLQVKFGADELMMLVASLPPQYKLVFNLYAIEGFSHKEIAETLQITESTSKSNLSRARVILQEKLNKVY